MTTRRQFFVVAGGAAAAPVLQGQNQPKIGYDLGDWGKSGIVLIPYDPLSPLFGPLAADLSGLYPYSFVLRNDSSKGILMYAARWALTDAQGHVATNDSVSGASDDDPAKAPIAPFADQLVMPVQQPTAPTALARTVGGLSSFIERKRQQYAKQTSIAISLEAVIFDDSLAVGADRNNAIPMFRARLDARRKLCAQILAANGDQGQITAYLSPLAAHAGDGGILEAGRKSSDAAYSAFLAIYESRTARSFLHLANRNLASLLELVERENAKTPLKIHR